MKHLICVVFLFLGTIEVAHAVPRFSLPAGTPCTTCHYNPSGAGGRTEVGFGTMNSVGALSFDTVEHNLMFGKRVSVGLDTRVQWVHLGRPTLALNDDGEETIIEPDFVGFPMQFQPSLAIRAVDGVWVYGSYNAGRRTFEENKICDPVYPGSSCFEAAAQVQTNTGLTMRAGMIQPSIGIRPDDHTTWTRGDAAQIRQPLIPPNYAEWGGEVSYQPVTELRTELGVVGTAQLDESLNQTADNVDLWPVAGLLRFTWLPQLEVGGSPATDEFAEPGEPGAAVPATKVNTWLGASLYGSDAFYMINGFVGAGLRNGLETRFEVSHSSRGADYRTLNGSWAASWAIFDWLVPHARVDRAFTDETKNHTAWQYVAGIEFFPIPFVEIRPEYRIVKTDEYVFGQPTVQLHLFY